MQILVRMQVYPQALNLTTRSQFVCFSLPQSKHAINSTSSTLHSHQDPPTCQPSCGVCLTRPPDPHPSSLLGSRYPPHQSHRKPRHYPPPASTSSVSPNAPRETQTGSQALTMKKKHMQIQTCVPVLLWIKHNIDKTSQVLVGVVSFPKLKTRIEKNLIFVFTTKFVFSRI